MTNYRKPHDWSDKKVGDAQIIYNKWMDGIEKHFPDGITETLEDEVVVSHLCNDMNTVGAIGRLTQLAVDAKKGSRESAMRLAFGMNLMGFIYEEAAEV